MIAWMQIAWLIGGVLVLGVVSSRLGYMQKDIDDLRYRLKHLEKHEMGDLK